MHADDRPRSIQATVRKLMRLVDRNVSPSYSYLWHETEGLMEKQPSEKDCRL